MIRCKNFNRTDTIASIEEWFVKCPPAGKIKHWVDGRSAKETARHWVNTIPAEFTQLIKCRKLTLELCSPEYNSSFDGYKGNVRNHDLLILAKDGQQNNAVISVESKVDETFDKYVNEYLNAVDEKKKKGEPTNAGKRLEDVLAALFQKSIQVSNGKLRYQLLSAVAGTLADAQRQKAKQAIFVVQTFISQNMSSVIHRQNQRDLDYFVELISDGKNKIIHDGDLLGPFRVPGNKYIPGNVDLFIGKYSVKI